MSWQGFRLSSSSHHGSVIVTPRRIIRVEQAHVPVINNMAIENPTTAQFSDTLPTELFTFNMADLVKTSHNTRLYTEVQTLKRLINELVDYQLAHPKMEKPATRGEVDSDTKTTQEIEKREKYIRAQLSIIKSLYRQSVLKVREEKTKTSDDRAVNDALILGMHNLKYEEQSLRSEISAAENYEYACKHPLAFAH